MSNDRCGKTMHGVTESTWLDYWRRRGTVPPRPIEQATSSQAKIVLNDDYWTRTFSQAAARLTLLTCDPCTTHSLHCTRRRHSHKHSRHNGFYFFSVR